MVVNGKYKCLSQCTTLTDSFLKPVQVGQQNNTSAGFFLNFC